MIRFLIAYENVVFDGQPQYLKDELSFYYKPWRTVDFSILIDDGHNSLDVELENGRVLQVTGPNPDYNWIKKQLFVPTFQRGSLMVLFDRKYQGGTGIQYAKEWQTYFDDKTGCVCIGNTECDSNCIGVEFAKNTVAVVDNEQLSSVWIKPQFI